MNRAILDLYAKHYVEPRFERAGLFELIQDCYGCNEALYPGSFIHITPSFFFSYVVYLDNNLTAIEFFADMVSVLEYVNWKKRYSRPAYVRFIAQDYSTGLPLENGQFELLISLYASGAARFCKKYLKSGGILATNNFQGEASEIEADPEYRLIGVARYRKQAYRLVEEDLGGVLAAGKAVNKKYLKQSSCGLQYSENEDYFIFRRETARG